MTPGAFIRVVVVEVVVVGSVVVVEVVVEVVVVDVEVVERLVEVVIVEEVVEIVDDRGSFQTIAKVRIKPDLGALLNVFIVLEEIDEAD